MHSLRRSVLIAVLLSGGLPRAEAVVRHQTSTLAAKTVHHPGLHIPTTLQPVGDGSGFYDARARRLTSQILSVPLVPGTGAGNALAGAAPADDDAGRDAVWNAVRGYVQGQRAVLRVDVAELGAPSVAVLEHGTLILVHAPRVLAGIHVRDSGLTAVLNHGNLVLLGLQNWGDADPRRAVDLLGETQARQRVVDHLKPMDVESVESGRLEYVPLASGGAYDYRLAWAVRARLAGDRGEWEALVDARSGELLLFADRNQYASRRVAGGVYPISNDQRPPDGLEQPGWPMPFADVAIGTNTFYTSSGGSLGCATGTGTTALSGRFVHIGDACGAVDETSAGDIALGAGPTAADTDCVVPAGHSAGDTKSARSAFYELNRMFEQGKGYLPGNAWLQAPLIANTNVTTPACNAFWNGTSVLFLRESADCRNTGEIAGVLDHEWGHGMDANGVDGALSSPGEGIADIRATLRTANSCAGRGFLKNTTCGGYGDPCIGTAATGCTGFRDADFANHASGQPHGITWIVSGANNGAGCNPDGAGGPCGREVHCEGQAVSEIGWDLQRRDMRAAPFNFDSNTALEMTTRLFYLGAEAVNSWYTCSVGCETSGTCGCEATGGYLQLLAADDDNGDLADGTPHMQAIFNAFDRHQMACTSPAVANTGCAGGPATAPAVTATAGIDSVTLAWNAVPGAARYLVYRTEGISACDLGKAKVGDVTGTAFTDTGLMSGRPYSYVVLPAGANPSCLGRASACASATPTARTCTASPDFVLSCTPAVLSIGVGGDGSSTCLVQSVNAFSSAVGLSCAGLPGGATCSFNPVSVTPAPGGAASSTLIVTAGAGTAPGSYAIQVQAASGALVRTFDIALTVTAVSVEPSALAMDTAGNGVFQPNETVDMAPTWRNAGASPISLSGTTSGFTGPAGAVYTNPGSAASYGTIGAGTSGTCRIGGGSCYTVRAAAATRPLTHWDTTILETVTPSSTTKTWTLHVGDSFTDVPATSGFYRFIETLLHRAVTGGCTGTTYCPTSPTTRDQMAVFALVSKEGPTYTPPACVAGSEVFTDVPASNGFCRWIEELVRRGVVSGCATGRYCPGDLTRREQMAVFVVRTADPAFSPPVCWSWTQMFADVPATSPFCRWIEELARRGVVTGCGGGNYCPGNPVTREQMAVFLTVTFGLTLYGV